MAEKIIPNCRYGHGDLVRENVGSDKPILFSVDTFPLLPYSSSPGSYTCFSFAIYKCPKCSYMELHDEALP